MKTTMKQFLALALLGILAFTTFSCSKKDNAPEPDYKKTLLNKGFDVWSLQQVQYYFQPNGGTKALYDTDNDPMVTDLRFLEASSLEYYDATNGHKAGTYELKGKTLIMRVSGVGEVTNTILQLSDDGELLLERKIENVKIDGKQGTQYIQTIYHRVV